ncbi:MAG TPA: hypothetical protein VL588_12720, partial [Bdellovibrionota bacterium]|nr:hypothetical protein [Bdellovibrionota bacterium]
MSLLSRIRGARPRLTHAAALAAPALLLLLAQTPYTNDKTATATWMTEAYARQGGVAASHIPCVWTPEAKPAFFRQWAEEPPLFHYLGVLLRNLGFTLSYHSLLPWLLTLTTLAGLASWISVWTPLGPLQLASLALLPALAIHSTRYIPDHLMLAALVWGLALWCRDRRGWGLALFTLAVTAKATAAFALLGLGLGEVMAHPSRLRPRELGAWAVRGSLTCLPFAAWLYYLHAKHIPNPFFEDSVSLSRHMGGNDWGILFTGRYAWRFVLWNGLRGVGLPLFLLALDGVWRVLKRWKETEPRARVLTVFVVTTFLYWIIVRGPQFTGPWYSFPFLPAWAAMGFLALPRRPAWLAPAALAITAAHALALAALGPPAQSALFSKWNPADMPVQ